MLSSPSTRRAFPRRTGRASRGGDPTSSRRQWAFCWCGHRGPVRRRCRRVRSGDPGEEHVEAVVELAFSVVVGEVGDQTPQDRELTWWELVEPEAQQVVG